MLSSSALQSERPRSRASHGFILMRFGGHIHAMSRCFERISPSHGFKGPFANPHAQNSSSAAAFLPVVGVSMQVLHRPDNDNLVFNRIIDAVGKTPDKIASDIFFDDSPSVRRSNDRLH